MGTIPQGTSSGTIPQGTGSLTGLVICHVNKASHGDLPVADTHAGITHPDTLLFHAGSGTLTWVLVLAQESR